MKHNIGHGDHGQSSSPFGSLGKSDIYFELLGGLDELSAHIGFLTTNLDNLPTQKVQLSEILKDIRSISSDLALATPHTNFDIRRLKLLENWLDAMEKELPPIKSFLLPLGHRSSSYAHLVRTVTRRVERTYFRTIEVHHVDGDGAIYLNRLSDYFFALARYINHYYGSEDIVG